MNKPWIQDKTQLDIQVRDSRIKWLERLLVVQVLLTLAFATMIDWRLGLGTFIVLRLCMGYFRNCWERRHAV